MRGTAVLLVVLVTSPIFASDPGQPLDCSDWVFFRPGLSCTMYGPFGTVEDSEFLQRGSNVASDNTERRYILRMILDEVLKTELVMWTATGEEVIARISDRPGPIGPGGTVDAVRPNDGRVLWFDAIAGRLLFELNSFCVQEGVLCPSGVDYGGGRWIAAIEGFGGVFEISQSYIPNGSEWAFTVPFHPEGFPIGTFFDTYYGDLATVGDWSQAEPLQCGYPATPPEPGDYLTVADPLPDPAPGTGRYYVTAVNYQGQRRYGRKLTNGALSGRDPAVLPGCE